MTTCVAYVGIATDSSCTKVSIAFHDGHFNIDSWILEIGKNDANGNSWGSCPMPGSFNTYQPPSQVTMITESIDQYAKSHSFKVLAAGVESDCWFSEMLSHYLWYSHDILPFRFGIQEGELEEKADSASRKCSMWFGPDYVPRLSIGYRNEVEVDNNCISFVQLEDYRSTMSSKAWNCLMKLADESREKGLRVSFFNATPQGGGVALMRHALLRLTKLLKLRVHWYVPKPSPPVFRITKNNHNILQGICHSLDSFTEQNCAVFEEWTRINCERYWVDGPFTWSQVIVLDDFQVAGFIPYIRKVNPTCKIIFRSHIEIRSDLIADSETVQAKLWNYLWNFIKHADLFISHPMENFIPSSVPRHKVLLMPASTDPFDGDYNLHAQCVNKVLGLNKQLSTEDVGTKILYPLRPYIAQIARFDPAKGIKDVLESYRLLRAAMNSQYPLSKLPQLVICGHGSIDDPDASIVFSELVQLVGTQPFEGIKGDICIARIPPSDKTLNAVLRGAKIALQLSHREGFEVKVTEALHKGIPLIAYNAGGIPLQLPDGYPYLVEIGNVQLVAKHMLKLLTNETAWKETSDLCKKWGRRERFWTGYQCVNWLWLFNRDCREETADNAEAKPHWVDEEWQQS